MQHRPLYINAILVQSRERRWYPRFAPLLSRPRHDSGSVGIFRI